MDILRLWLFLHLTYRRARILFIVSSKCWEKQKREQADGVLPSAFANLRRDKKMLRMGRVSSWIQPGAHTSTVTRHIYSRIEHVSKYVNDGYAGDDTTEFATPVSHDPTNVINDS
jgi:hypothetical protein